MGYPVRVQLSRAKGWKMPPNTVKVDRSTRWGNPYVVGEAVDLKQVRRWGWHLSPAGKMIICESVEESVRRFTHCLAMDQAFHPFVRETLRGKNLACWCKLPRPGEPDVCHAAVLLELANK